MYMCSSAEDFEGGGQVFVEIRWGKSRPGSPLVGDRAQRRLVMATGMRVTKIEGVKKVGLWKKTQLHDEGIASWI